MTEVISKKGLARVVSWSTTNPLVTPAYFPALSSTATGPAPVDLVRLIRDVKYPRVLASAYDVAPPVPGAEIRAAIREHRDARNAVFLDSGVFESFWRKDAGWSFDDFRRAASRTQFDVFTSYDGAVHRRGAASTSGYSKKHIQDSFALAPDALGLAIVHGTSPATLVKNVRAFVAEDVAFGGLAIPERECGPNVYERALTIRKIREILSDDAPRMLHILGCGHPQAMAAYVWAGADSFDSLDWCQVGMDNRRMSYTDLSLIGSLQCECRVCSNMTTDNLQRALLHNLAFYQEFVGQLQRMIREDTLKDFLVEHLGTTLVHQVPAR